jgi:phosphatidylinositol 3-kinase
VGAFRQLTHRDVLLILPQLVQALRYEPQVEGSALMDFLLELSQKHFETASFLNWLLGLETVFFPEAVTAQQALLAHLYDAPHTHPWLDRMTIQIQFVRALARIQRKAKSYSGRERDTYLQQLLSDHDTFNLETLVAQGLPLPLNPSLIVTGVVPHLSHCFESAMHPVLFAFSVSVPNKVAKVIYKKGDDLRQDHLVCQVIRLIDRLWKEDGLDLKLTPYRVLPTGHDEGLVHVVPHARSLARVLRSQKGAGIRGYLREHNFCETAPDHILPQALDNYVRSCAGYCIITYVLGIGDRHCDNILICPDGRILHIDFGYMFGRDPKPFPPAMKISRDMSEAMGGAKGVLCQQFLEHCWAGYRIVRHHAKLLGHLMALMKDSELRCLDLGLTRQSLRLDLDDSQAKAHILQVVESSMAAFIPEIMDALHDMAMRRREERAGSRPLPDT